MIDLASRRKKPGNFGKSRYFYCRPVSRFFVTFPFIFPFIVFKRYGFYFPIKNVIGILFRIVNKKKIEILVITNESVGKYNLFWHYRIILRNQFCFDCTMMFYTFYISAVQTFFLMSQGFGSEIQSGATFSNK